MTGRRSHFGGFGGGGYGYRGGSAVNPYDRSYYGFGNLNHQG